MTRRSSFSDRGAAAVEFAFVALLLVSLLMGVMEFGRMWAIQGSLAQASRDAARTAAITDDAGAGQDKFGDVFWPLAPGGSTGIVTGSDVPVRTGTPGSEDCRWTVAPTYQASSLTGMFGEWSITARGSMRCNG